MTHGQHLIANHTFPTNVSPDLERHLVKLVWMRNTVVFGGHLAEWTEEHPEMPCAPALPTTPTKPRTAGAETLALYGLGLIALLFFKH